MTRKWIINKQFLHCQQLVKVVEARWQQCQLSHTSVLDLLLFNWDQTNKRSVKMTAIKLAVFESFWTPFDLVCKPELMQRFRRLPFGPSFYFLCSFNFCTPDPFKRMNKTFEFYKQNVSQPVCNLYNIRKCQTNNWKTENGIKIYKIKNNLQRTSECNFWNTCVF